MASLLLSLHRLKLWISSCPMSKSAGHAELKKIAGLAEGAGPAHLIHMDGKSRRKCRRSSRGRHVPNFNILEFSMANPLESRLLDPPESS